jgi:uncharacterized Fe-S radical SAM superfamily protein PflX
MEIEKILPNHFFSTEREKIKLNWFAFEIASEIEVTISKSLIKTLKRHGYSQSDINLSCIKLARLLQIRILEFLDKRIPYMEIDYTQIEKAFPNLDDKIINKLVDCTAKAWDNMLRACETCPQACISNKNDYCSMFDDKYYYE